MRTCHKPLGNPVTQGLIGCPDSRKDDEAALHDLVPMTLITMQAEAPNDSVKPLPVVTK